MCAACCLPREEECAQTILLDARQGIVVGGEVREAFSGRPSEGAGRTIVNAEAWCSVALQEAATRDDEVVVAHEEGRLWVYSDAHYGGARDGAVTCDVGTDDLRARVHHSDKAAAGTNARKGRRRGVSAGASSAQLLGELQIMARSLEEM